ncbi:MAG: hypothetical protein KDM63_17330 [Verrucomicrobiae bacterium]|nr:hypothetical protein [Verrucomicrobiae bacterium]
MPHPICYERWTLPLYLMDGIIGVIAAISLIGWIATRYSIWCLPLIVSVAILAEDECYPLSYFPMYSDPDESENFLYVATFETDPARHQPLPIHNFTGLSAPKVKKMEDKYREDYAKKLKKKDKELTDEDIATVGSQLLDEFRAIAAGKQKTLPDHLALVEVWIEADDDGGWTETATILAAQSAPGQALPPISTTPVQ